MKHKVPPSQHMYTCSQIPVYKLYNILYELPVVASAVVVQQEYFEWRNVHPAIVARAFHPLVLYERQHMLPSNKVRHTY